ncbi:MAG: hypothetical protein K0R98_1215 [Rickettsiaceae bacterium]|nr:hypothetical protein [Rickettsiaceae bacterium]
MSRNIDERFSIIDGAGLNIGELDKFPGLSQESYIDTKKLRTNQRRINVADSIGDSFLEFLGVFARQAYSHQYIGASIEYGDIIFSFNKWEGASRAFASIKAHSPGIAAKNIVCVSYKGENFVLIPSAVRADFLCNCLGFNYKFSNLVRDIGTIQRAQIHNHLSQIKVVEKNPKHDEVSAYAMSQAIGPLKITRPSYTSRVLLSLDSLPIGMQDELKAEMESALELRNQKRTKGYYDTMDACWTDRRAVASLAKILNKNEFKGVRLEGAIESLLGQSDKLMLDCMFYQMIDIVKRKAGNLNELGMNRIVEIANSEGDIKNLQERMKDMVVRCKEENAFRVEKEEKKYAGVDLLIFYNICELVVPKQEKEKVTSEKKVVQAEPEREQKKTTKKHKKERIHKEEIKPSGAKTLKTEVVHKEEKKQDSEEKETVKKSSSVFKRIGKWTDKTGRKKDKNSDNWVDNISTQEVDRSKKDL